MKPSARLLSPALAQLCQFEVLGVDEERKLFRRLSKARAGKSKGARAPAAIRNRIALANLRLVVSVAKRFANSQQPVEDLVSDASLLLLGCVEHFDPGRGTRFSTYATRSLAHHFLRLRKREGRRRLRSLSASRLEPAASAKRRNESLERLIDEEERKQLSEELAALPDSERELLAGRFGLDGNSEPKTFRDLAAALGISREWARVTTTGALDHLRNALTHKQEHRSVPDES